MKQIVKKSLEAVAPSLLNALRSLKMRYECRSKLNPLRICVRNEFYNDSDISVLSGPFKGMKYIDEMVWGSITPKWLGSYEMELHEIIEEITKKSYSAIIDVGCAEGFYAVGLPYRIPSLKVYAYDIDFVSRRQVKQLAVINKLENRIEISGLCSHEEISRVREQSERLLLICDIEGFERSLLDPVACPALSEIDILVEIHEGGWDVSTRDLLLDRFQVTHDFQEIQAVDRRGWIAANQEIASRLPDKISEAVDEHRSNGYTWLWLESKSSFQRKL